MAHNRRRPGSEEPADTHVTQRELDAELRGISFKIKVAIGLAGGNFITNAVAIYLKSVPPQAHAVGWVAHLFS